MYLESAPNTTGFRHVSVGPKEVWATTNGGVVLRRIGICPENPIGSYWDLGIPVRIFQINYKIFSVNFAYAKLGFSQLDSKLIFNLFSGQLAAN